MIGKLTYGAFTLLTRLKTFGLGQQSPLVSIREYLSVCLAVLFHIQAGLASNQ
jgi:hypothetical protein